MQHEVKIREANIQAHLDLEEEIKLRQNGLITFTIRVNTGNIVDLNVTEYINVRQKYGIIKAVLIHKSSLTLDTRK